LTTCSSRSTRAPPSAPRTRRSLAEACDPGRAHESGHKRHRGSVMGVGDLLHLVGQYGYLAVLLGRPPLRPTLCAALGTVRLYHARALGTRRDILRPARRQSRIPGTLRCGSESLRGSGGGHRPHALEKVRPLQRPGWKRLGYGGSGSRLFPVGQHRPDRALGRAVFPSPGSGAVSRCATTLDLYQGHAKWEGRRLGIPARAQASPIIEMAPDHGRSSILT
jgi:hypothetical protein